jgi:hypothetical protein
VSERKINGIEYDESECPFCGKVYIAIDEENYMDQWAPTECDHKCCGRCAVYTEKDGVYLCPTCAKKEGLADPPCKSD